MEGGRSDRCPHVACDGSREQPQVRNDVARGREGSRAAWSTEAWPGSQRDSIRRFGGRHMTQERCAQTGQSSTWERAGLLVQRSSARAGGAPPITTAPAARRRKGSALAALLGKRFVISLRSYFFAPPPLPPATRSPRKEGGAALWQVARRTHAWKGKSGLRGCRNLDFDAAQC